MGTYSKIRCAGAAKLQENAVVLMAELSEDDLTVVMGGYGGYGGVVDADPRTNPHTKPNTKPPRRNRRNRRNDRRR
ncbi:hypothetical protein KDI_43750 [Dictyobacter arantiisoli]|uniref:Uncharacterized protein n=2 Tax=Dictyobacter arantiisoli TaxID=2014874 RepID=A0A5A5TGV6_9CHLR|nr:hypothetical protein KDI_43750 [Dictyobacter arantiisoli]